MDPISRSPSRFSPSAFVHQDAHTRSAPQYGPSPSRPESPPAQAAPPWMPAPPTCDTPADLHPWGGKLVQIGHALSQYSARVQAFFEGLVGLSTPQLTAANYNAAVAAMAVRLCEIQRLSGEAPSAAEGLTADALSEAARLVGMQQQARERGVHINRGIMGAYRWGRAWFVATPPQRSATADKAS